MLILSWTAIACGTWASGADSCSLFLCRWFYLFQSVIWIYIKDPLYSVILSIIYIYIRNSWLCWIHVFLYHFPADTYTTHATYFLNQICTHIYLYIYILIMSPRSCSYSVLSFPYNSLHFFISCFHLIFLDVDNVNFVGPMGIKGGWEVFQPNGGLVRWEKHRTIASGFSSKSLFDYCMANPGQSHYIPIKKPHF